MHPLRLVASRPFEQDLVLLPEQLHLLCGVFDEVWDTVKAQYVSDPQRTKLARVTLANCMLAKYRCGLTNREMLKAVAVLSIKRPA